MIFERVESFLDEVRRPGKELECMTGKKGGGNGEKGRWELTAYVCSSLFFLIFFLYQFFGNWFVGMADGR